MKKIAIVLLLSLMSALFFLLSASQMHEERVALQKTNQEVEENYEKMLQMVLELETYTESLDIIFRKAGEYDVPPEVVLAIMKLESNYDVNAISKTNDYGIMQINEYHLRNFDDKMEALDLSKNIECGVSLLSSLQQESRDMHYILNSYNMGPVGYQNYIARTGEVSRNYSRKVIEYIKILKGE